MATGKVWLVGAGPGDPGLLTIKGRRVLEQADVVLYDALASPRLLDYAPASAERIYVGKKRAAHEKSQEEIDALLVAQAQLGRRVVRLKGGDPFIFARGGEEVEALAAAGIPFEIVPGVTVPLGVAAYTGVPLTHREHTSAVTFVTGHRVDAIDWAKVGAAETVVLFMGVANVAAIAQEMIARGRSANTPAMAVRYATRPDQETVVATLGTLADRLHARGLRPPATIVIGDVVSLYGRFNWFERLPLFGQRIVATRDVRQSRALSEPLEALGADVVSLPVIDIQAPLDPEPLQDALANLATYDWVIFTSVNGVKRFIEALDQANIDLRRLQARIAAIGPATRDAVEALHLRVDCMPKEYVAESLLTSLAEHPLDGQRVLLPRAAVARDVVPEALRKRGAHVDVVEAYRTLAPANLAAAAQAVLSRKPHWLTFTSSSTVRNLVDAVGLAALQGIRIASIGPITSATARELGLSVDVEAQPHTIAGLIDALLSGA
jgi:uroporphyrinogen III methyltransferase / synthase